MKKYKTIKHPINKHYDTPSTMEYTVVHVDLGNLKGTINTLEGHKSASYHDYVDRDSENIYEFVDAKKYSAWHSGHLSKPTKAFTKLFGYKNPNRHSYGICYGGRGVDRNGRIARSWDRNSPYGAVDGQKATESQIERLMYKIIEKGMNKKPIFAHVELTSYKPKAVLYAVNELKKRLEVYNKSLEEEKNGLSKFSLADLFEEILTRLKINL
jgi:N-acetyl-anhydromuramyl-L-alanine amidase AmpD